MNAALTPEQKDGTKPLKRSIDDLAPNKDNELQKGEENTAQRLAEIMMGRGMLNQPPAQPTDEQMFGHLVTKPEDLAKKEAEWGGAINNWLAEATKPISSRFASEEEEMAYWKSIKIQDNGSIPD